MEAFQKTFLENKELLWQLLIEHIQLTVIAVLISTVIGISLGILMTKHKTLANGVMGSVNIVQAIPSLAILGFLIPIMGIGKKPAIFMAIIYAILPIIKNTYTGLSTIDPKMIEVANGVGLTPTQVLTRIKIPLAMPIIMAGIRIAAVTSVGLMTIAAFVGGGGLGYMVFSGIQVINPQLILLGAIPIALLALTVDSIVGLIEQGVTPKGISIGRYKAGLKPKIAIGIVSMMILFVCVPLFSAPVKEKNVIRIGTKLDSEGSLLGAMLCYLVNEQPGFVAEPKLKLGNTQILFEAIKKGEVDVCVDYTGTMLMSVLGEENSYTTSEEVYNRVKKVYADELGLSVLQPFGMNNTYAIGIRKETHEKYNLHTLSDLKAVSDKLIAGTTIEFANREDGLVGLQNRYDLNFKAVKPVDGSLRYTAIGSKETDLIDAYATDAMIQQFDLVLLKDEDEFFPPYYGVPIIRTEVLVKYPELEKTLNTLAGLLTDDVMRTLNYKVDVEKQDVMQVAYTFLVEEGYIEKQ